MKKLILTAAFAVLLTACNGGAESTTTTTATTTTTTQATTTTIAPTTTTTGGPVYSEEVVVYVLDDSGSNGFRQPPFLYPISVPPLAGTDELEASLRTLLDLSGFDTEIPAGTSVDSVTQAGSTVEVDLSSEFESGGGSASMFARLAQLTFTLTRVDGVDDVLLMEGGSPVSVFSSEGIVLDGPMVREDFEDQLPGILVDFPAAGETVAATFDISGAAAAFEGVFQLEVLQGNTILFAPDFVSTGSGIGFGSFSVEAVTSASPGTNLTIRVWENSAEDGSVISERFVPVTVEN